MEITAWYDDIKRLEAMQNVSEVYYYMVHATNVEERRNWAVEYTERLVNLPIHDSWQKEQIERYKKEQESDTNE